MQYDWDFGSLLTYAPAFARGVCITLELAFFSSSLGTLLAVPAAILLHRHPLIGKPLVIVVDIIRATPNLVLIFFFYYFPYKQVLGVDALSGFGSALVALTVAQAAYSTDLIRAALDQVPQNQVIGVQGLGFKPWDVSMNVVIPSVVRQVLVAHIALWIGNIKLSSLASVIGVEDVVFVARVATSQNFRSLESWVVVAIIYAILVIPLGYLSRRLELSDWVRRQ